MGKLAPVQTNIAIIQEESNSKLLVNDIIHELIASQEMFVLVRVQQMKQICNRLVRPLR
jgi:hypothetical protein